jgi:hypothetical protein
MAEWRPGIKKILTADWYVLSFSSEAVSLNIRQLFYME